MAFPLRILCVDDNRDVADSAADLLNIVGFEAQACYSGPAALLLAEAFLPQICLIDLNMIGMDGDEVARRLRQTGRPVVLISVTAMNDEDSIRRIWDAGFDFHMVKPFDPKNLLNILAAFQKQIPH